MLAMQARGPEFDSPKLNIMTNVSKLSDGEKEAGAEVCWPGIPV